MKTSIAVLGLILALSGSWAEAQQRSADPVSVHIQAQPMQQALDEFARQTGLQLVFATEEVARGMTAPAVSGSYAPKVALDILLADSGLRYEFINSKTVAIEAVKRGEGVPAVGVGSGTEGVRVVQAGASSAEEGGGSQREESQEAGVGDSESKLEEIVVTAQKRVERLQDVPVPVTAINAQALVDSNQTRIQDYYTRIPGLNVIPTTGQFQGAPQLVIRGITTGAFSGNPTVGIVVDDVPYGATTQIAGGIVAPDIDPSDLARVEVLRGPQGTLYGASSMGGLLKFVSTDPSTERVSGRIQAGMSDVHNAGDVGYNARGAINVPLGDKFAIRASGFTRSDPGYVDNVQTGERGTNSTEAEGGRLAALFKPTDAISVRLAALFQHLELGGSGEVDLLHTLSTVNPKPPLEDLQQSRLLGTGGNDRKFQAYSASIDARIGDVNLVSISGYSVNHVDYSVDYTAPFAPLRPVYQPVFGVIGLGGKGDNETDKFTQEIRLTGLIGQRVEWLIGGFYTHERTNFGFKYLAIDPASGAVAGTALNDNKTPIYKEYAAFGDLTFHVTDRFDIQVGGRESKNTQSYSAVTTGLLAPYLYLLPSPVVVSERNSDDNSFTYLVTPRFKLSPSLMLYARMASGYRPGGPNANTTLTGVSPIFGPDATRTYEVGIKGDLLDRALTVDASVYYTDWEGIQLALRNPVTGVPYIDNAGGAKSQGVELSLQSMPAAGLTIAAWAAWNNAELTQSFPSISPSRGVAGDRLPNSARWSGHLSLDQEFPLIGSAEGLVGASVSYVGDTIGQFATQNVPRQKFAAYTSLDLRAGMRYESWTLNLFATNVTDKRAAIAGGSGTALPNTFVYIQPRTVGLSVATTF